MHCHRNLATYQYDSLSRRSSVTFGNGVVQGYTYDNAARLATRTNDLASTANDLTQTFSYNPASRITSVTRSNDLYAWTGHANASLSSASNGLNQITNVGASSVTHDARGNITAVGSDSYGYDGENQLTSGPGSSTLSYDPVGRLNQVLQGASTTRIGYDGLDRIAEYDGGNAVLRRYIHGPGIDNPIVWYEGSGTASRRFLSSDERGSVISVTDGSGTVLNLNKYDEYGVPQSTNLGKFGYTGQAWVPEVGLWYYKARFYWADGNRFMQTDPIGYAGGPNLYSYVGNDPVNFIDPLGLDPPVLLNPGCASPVGCYVEDDGTIVVTGSGGLNDYARAGQASYILNRAFNFLNPFTFTAQLERQASKDAKRGERLNTDRQCGHSNSTAATVADWANTISAGAGAVAGISAGLGLVTAPTGAGFVGFEAIAAAASGVSIAAGAIGFAANVIDRNWEGAGWGAAGMIGGAAAGQWASNAYRSTRAFGDLSASQRRAAKFMGYGAGSGIGGVGALVGCR